MSTPSDYTPPEYSVRFSPRAKSVRLRVLPGRGLEVVLPLRTNPACVPALLFCHRKWIEKHLTKMQPISADNAAPTAVPTGFYIRGNSEYIEIQPHRAAGLTQASTTEFFALAPPDCVPQNASGEGIEEGFNDSSAQPEAFAAPDPGLPDSTLSSPRTALRKAIPVRRIILPATLHPKLAPQSVLNWLREWVRKEARQRFGALLTELAVEYGFSFTGLCVRFQRSRWGSCSVRGNINLNASLLFLPDTLARYIILHELCHTKEMNHSERFWKLVFAVDPDALARDKAMRGAWRYVPSWITR